MLIRQKQAKFDIFGIVVKLRTVVSKVKVEDILLLFLKGIIV